MKNLRAADTSAIRIEAANEWAWCGDRRLDLAPRVFQLLRHLVEHPQRLITKDELLTAVWEGTAVSEAALTSCIRDLRKELGDSSGTPRYIETVHRRGFRFIGPIASPGTRPPTTASAPVAIPPPSAAFVGRDAELARLHALLDTALGGERRLVFVTGEAGIGKTTLVEALLTRLGGVDGLRIGRGQCVEHYGATEAYLPVLEALGRMGRERGGEALVQVLKQYAPTWLAQLPALLRDEELEGVQRRAQGTTRERMLRELIEAFDALSHETPLVLLLEDLHWSDAATLDLLSMLARRRDPARLLILGTYRPADVEVGAHPLKAVKQELQLHGRCEEVALDFLDEAALGEYLARRFPHASFAPEFPRMLRANTSGNPLFLVNAIDDLVAQGQVREVDGRWELSVPVDRIASSIPHTLWQMVEKQVERLSAHEQTVLAVGSVAGAEFSAALSTVDGIDAQDGERVCDALARRGLCLRAAGAAEWPDGTLAARYGFIHALYRNVLYARIPIGHRVGLHLRIGTRLEEAYGSRASDIAGELAMHFEEGRELERAVRYRGKAAENALRQHAYAEAVTHARRALDLLATWPESPERDRHELAIQTVRGAAVVATRGWAAPEVADAYERARDLCARTGVTPQLYPVLVGLAGFCMMRGQMRVAAEVCAQLLAHARNTQDATGLLGGHNMSGLALFYGGEFIAALKQFERAKTFYDPELHSPNRQLYLDHDPGVSCAAHTAMTLMMLGHQDRADATMRECLRHARAIDHPLTVAMAYNFAATMYQFRRDPDVVREIEEVRLEYSTKHDFDLFLLLGEIYRGWLAAEEGRCEEAVAQIAQGLMMFQAIGAELGRPTFLSILADVYGRLGRTDEALATLDEAVAQAGETGLHYWDAELRRVRGELLLSSGATSEAEASFLEAIEIARRQQAKACELRAAMGVSRLWERTGKAKRAHALLSEIYAWFTEGFDTPDLVDAKALLARLGGESVAGRRRSR